MMNTGVYLRTPDPYFTLLSARYPIRPSHRPIIILQGSLIILRRIQNV